MVNEISLGKRRICKVNYSFTISLPKVWIENAAIKEKDFVQLTMKGKSLVIKPYWNDVIETVQ